MSAKRASYLFWLASALILLVFPFSCLAETVQVQLDFPLETLSVTSQDGYDYLTLPGCHTGGRAGAPALPRRAVYVSIPAGTSVASVQVTQATKEELAGEFVVYPAQRPVPTLIGEDEPEFVGPDPAIYETDEPYPSRVVIDTGSGSLAGYNIVGLLVTPFEYRPMSKRLSLYVSLSITLNLVSCQTSTLPVYNRSQVVKRVCQERARRLVVNSDSVFEPAFYPSPMGAFDTVECVIITGSSYVDEVQPLADWLIRKGYRTEIHSVSSIDAAYGGQDTQEKIRNFLKDYYSTKSLGWVILGGDTGVVPTRIAYAFDYGNDGFDAADYQQCDYYYADLDGTWNDDGDQYWGEVADDNIDMYADVIVGRLPFDSESEASSLVEKVLTYEGVGSTQLPTDYEKKLLMFACKLDSSTWGGDCKDELESYVNIPGDYTITRLYDRDGTSGKSAVLASMNEGYNLINNVGHANYSLMSAKYVGTAEYLYRSDMSGLANSPRYSVLYSIGCWAAAIDYDCIAERFVLAPSGGGIAFVGNSRYGWYSPGSPGDGPSDLFDQEFFASIFNSGVFELGEAVSDSKQAFVSYSKSGYGDSKYFRWVLYGLNLLGPATTPVWTETPAQISASYDDTFYVGQDEFDVYVEGAGPLQSAVVCLYKEDEVFETAYTDSTGWAHITVSPSASSAGTMFVTVTKHNYLPHRGSVDVQDQEGNSAPSLSDGSVSPSCAQSSSSFTYSVHYSDADSDAPQTALVYIDGQPHDMSLSSGQAWDGDYEYEASGLSAGSHSYYFYFEDGNGGSDRLPSDGTYDGPDVDDTKPSSSCSCPTYTSNESVSVTFSASDSGCGVSETKLYYKYSGGSWEYSGQSKGGTSGSFDFSFGQGEGTYYFYTISIDNAGNVEDAPEGPDDSTIFDHTGPASSCSSPTYSTSSPITVTFTASDGRSGVATTKLYYSFNGGEYEYSGYQSSGSSGSFSFNPPDGDGTYQFYTISIDNAGNEEEPPGSADTTTIYDTAKPESSCSSPTYANSSPLTIEFTASDSGSGVSTTKLYYSFNGGDYSYSGQEQSGTSGSFSFSLTEGEGTYRFYTLASDNAGNQEEAPANPDDTTIYDTTKPSSSCSSPQYAYTSPITVSFSSSDNLSGVSTTKLFYRFEDGEFTDSGQQESGSSGSFSFSPSQGAGTYYFYTVATDNAGNQEDAPGSPDSSTTYDPSDNTRPESCCRAPLYSNTKPIDVRFFASDDKSGVASVRLYYSFNGGEYQDSGVSQEGSSSTILPPPLHEVFVSPDGSPDAAGTIDDPKDLKTVFEDPNLQPGTIVWLLGGEYSSATEHLSQNNEDGTENRPIIYTPYPGQNALVRGRISLRRSSTYWIGMECSCGQAASSGLNIYGGDDVRIINNLIHDQNHSGIGGWNVGSGHIFYGNLIWGIANDPDDPRGHAIYTQNDYPTHGEKTVSGNILFRNHKFSLHVYGEGGPELSGFRVFHNISFGNHGYFLLGGGGKVRLYNDIVRDNYFYEPTTYPLMPGWYGPTDTITVQNNYIASGGSPTWFRRIRHSAVVTGNTFISSGTYRIFFEEYKDEAPQYETCDWDYNTYYEGSGGQFKVLYCRSSGNTGYTFDEWRALTGWDEHSQLIEQAVPSHNKIVVLPNEYAIKRAHIAIYNWEGLDTVDVDVSSVLTEGDYFRLLDVEDYFGEPVLEGTYDGKALPVPMAGAEFRCFVLTATSFTPPEGEGTYAFYTIATDNAGNEELPPDTPDAVTVYDPTPPSSECSCVTATNSSPIEVSFSSHDQTSGVSETKLYYRFNGQGWSYSGLQESGTSGSFAFSPPEGQGTYWFYTIAADEAGNTEDPPGSADDSVIYDTGKPTSSCRSDQYVTSLPLVVEFTAQDSLSGVASTRLYYSFEGGDFSDTGLKEDGTSGSFSFSPAEGEGQYSFYTLATDEAGNQESPPEAADCSVVYDATVPSSSCSSPEFSSQQPVEIVFWAEDATSGIASTELFYRYEGGDWGSTGLYESGGSGTFDFVPPDGDGTYEFYVISTDNAGNTEPPKDTQAATVYDTGKPSSTCQSEELSNEQTVTVSYSADDTLSGVANVKLYWRYEAGQWEYTGKSSADAQGSFGVELTQGDGLYEFYTVAQDNAGNLEDAPESADTAILLDQAPPASTCSSPETSEEDFQVSYEAQDGEGSGVAVVRLWFRYSLDGGQTWDPDWSFSGMQSTEASGSFAYHPELGEGIYQFYTIAEDEAGNLESAPESADSSTDFVTDKPASNATSPGSTNQSPIAVQYKARDSSGIKEVRLWCRYKQDWDAGWSSWEDTGLRAYSTEGVIDFAPGEYAQEAIYQFYTIAVDRFDNVEDPPSVADCESIYDTTDPISRLQAPELASSGTINVDYSVSDDLSSLATVSLWFRYSADCGETFAPDWGQADLSSSDESGTFEYTASLGDGLYQFKVLSVDAAGNEEEKGVEPDGETLLDTAAPRATVSTAAYASQTPLRLDFEATDGTIGSGVRAVRFWYRYNQGDWVETDVVGEGSSGTVWFEPPEGNGSYEFFALATDAAGNSEQKDYVAETSVVLDDQMPASSVWCSPFATSAHILLSYEASGGASGVEAVTLWYRFSVDGGQSWDVDWTDTGLSADATSGTFDFAAEQGEGRYEFYSICQSGAGLVESPPEQCDACCIFDATAPSCELSAPERSRTTPIQVDFVASDGQSGSGVSSVELWFRFDGGQWRDTGLLAGEASGSFSFVPSLGEGLYEFYAVVKDQAGNCTGEPQEPQASTLYDTTPPSSSLTAPDAVNEPTLRLQFATVNGDDLDTLTLFYRFSHDCGGSWDVDWTESGQATSGTQGVIVFEAPHGEGLYQFRTIACDKAGNCEAKDWSDAETRLDQSQPLSSLDTSNCATQALIRLEFTASDEGCSAGIERVRLFFRTPSSGWEQAEVYGEGSAGTLWFMPTKGQARYQFCSQAVDAAGNVEPFTGEPKSETLFDHQAPTSVCYCQEYSNASPIEVGFVATDSVSVPAQTRLYYRFRTKMGGWAPDWVYSGEQSWGSCGTIAFEPGRGDGIYQFWTQSQDECANQEDFQPEPEAQCIFDTQPPFSTVSAATIASSLPVRIGYSSSDLLSGVKRVEFFYQLGDESWQPTGYSTSATTGVFEFDGAPGEGVYRFLCAASDRSGNTEAPGVLNTVRVHLDWEAPVSCASSPSFANSLPVLVQCTGTDNTGGTGVARLELFYRFEGGDWQPAGLFSENATSATFEFNAPEGDGLYEFYCVATDRAGNREAAKDEAEAETLLDRTRPASSCSSVRYFTQAPIIVSYLATASSCRIEAVSLWFRRFDGLSWSQWSDSGTAKSATSGTLAFWPEGGDGVYEFYTIAADECGGVEVAPSVADCSTTYDTTPPSTSISVPEYSSSSTVSVQFVSDDGLAGSGSGEVRFWLRKAGGQWQPVSRTGYGPAGSIEVCLSEGDGRYEFVAVGSDLAGNMEQFSGQAQAWLVLDQTEPSSECHSASYTQVDQANVEVSASDALTGVARILLWERKQGGTWELEATVSGSTSASVAAALSDGQGRYDFCSTAVDAVGNREPFPEQPDCSVVYDAAPPQAECQAARYANSSPILVEFSASDDLSPIASVTLWSAYRSGALEPTDRVEGESEGTFEFVPGSGEGTYRFAVQAKDAAGNAQQAPSSSRISVTFDVTPPGGSCAAPASTKASPIPIHFYCSDSGSGLRRVCLYYSLGESDWADSGVSSELASGVLNFYPEAEGKYRFSVVGEDVAGNRSEPGTGGIGETIYDVSAPDVSLWCPAATSQAPIRITFEASDKYSSVTRVALYYRYKSAKDGKAGSWQHSNLFSSASSGTFSFIPSQGWGTYDFAAVATDSLGNQNSLGDDALCSVRYEAAIPVLSPSSGSYDFGEVAKGKSSEWRLVLRNTGGGTLRIDRLETSGDFWCNATVPILIEAGGSHSIRIIFCPQDYGLRTGWLKITSNDAQRPVYTITLTGTGFKENATPQVTLVLNDSVYQPGDRLVLKVEAEYLGYSTTADLYVCVLLLDGTLLFPPTYSAYPAPFLSSVKLWPGYTLEPTTVSDLHIPEAPPGRYTFYAAFTHPGTLQALGQPAFASLLLDGPPSIDLFLNSRSFSDGDEMILSRTIRNPGRERTVDMYVGITFPDSSTLFYPSLTEEPQPFSTNIVLKEGEVVGPGQIVKLTLPELSPGRYWWLAVVTSPGVFEPISDVASAEWTYK